MHARDLVELAGILSAHGSALVRQSGPLCRAGLEEYWTASKSRLDRWGHRLKRDGAAELPISDEPRAFPPGRRALLEEILTGEMLARVWAAVACAHDRLQQCDDAELTARSVLIGQLEARHRVLLLIVSGRELAVEEAIRLDRLRRKVERWTDMLVGLLAALHDVREFAFEPDRAADFSRDLDGQLGLRGGRHAWSLVQASLRAAFQRALTSWSPNADLNARIAGGILACLPPEVFDSTGLPRSLWSLRFTQAASDADGMLSQLLALDQASRPLGKRPPGAERFRIGGVQEE